MAAAATRSPASASRRSSNSSSSSILLLYESPRGFSVELPLGSVEPVTRGIAELLEANEQLRLAFSVELPQPPSSSRPFDSPAPMSAREVQLMMLHELLELEAWISVQPAATRLQVTLLLHSALNPWFEGDAERKQLIRECNTAARALRTPQHWHTLYVPLPRLAPGSVHSLSDPLPAVSHQPASRSRLQLRIATCFADALRGHPLGLVVVPTQCWFLKQQPQAAIESSIEALLRYINTEWQPCDPPCQRYPPVEWDRMTEDKHAVWEVFRDRMLPSRWALIGGASAECAARAACWAFHGLDAGTYIVKGGYSEAADAVFSHVHVPLVSGSSAPLLVSNIMRIATDLHQTRICVQPFLDSFRRNEFRFWCLAQRDPRNNQWRWRIVSVVRTGWRGRADSGFQDLDVSAAAPVRADVSACQDFVEELLQHRYLLELRQAGCRAVRIDCGYNPATRAAFLNELTLATWAAFFTHATDMDVQLHVAAIFAQDWACMLQGHQLPAAME
jgi:hypothetical protein